MFLVCAIALAFVASDLPVVFKSSTAQAQGSSREWKPFGSILRLFGGGRKEKKKRRHRKRARQLPRANQRLRPQKRTSRRLRPKSSRSTKVVRKAPAVPKLVELPKDPDAKVVMVIGDALAAGLAKGLKRAFAKTKNVATVDRSRGSSGLARAELYDWTVEAKAKLEAKPSDFIVVMIGVNDRQKIRLNGESHPRRSEKWDAIYRARVTALVNVLVEAGKPFYWVGLPPTSSSKMSQDLAYFNTLYKEAVEQNGGVFIDIWNIFVNEDGRYTSYGPDIDGRRRRLRAKNGITFTIAGNRKLAFFVERELRRAVKEGVTDLAGLVPGTDAEGKQIGIAIPLSDPLARAHEKLAGGDQKAAEVDETTAHFQRVVRGDPIKAPSGRIDDHRWPPSERVPDPAQAVDLPEDLAPEL